MTTWVVPLAKAADAGAGCGGKAEQLAALIRAGLLVPEGVVLCHAAFAAVAGHGQVTLDGVGHALAAQARAISEAAIPADLVGAVAAAIALWPRLAVRSSMSIEDRAGGGAPGVFASCVDVAPSAVWPAIRAVWASALSPLAVAYARHRGAPRIEIGVILQRFVPGARITVYTRPPGRPDEDAAWVELAGGDLAPVSVARRPQDRGTTTPPELAGWVDLALAAEAAIGAGAGGADVELIAAADRPMVVQARPIRHPAPRPRQAPPPPVLFTFSRATPGVAWRWDAAHNPEPMSAAQAGLVELVDDAAAAPYRMQVVAGYLYWAPRHGPAPQASEIRTLGPDRTGAPRSTAGGGPAGHRTQRAADAVGHLRARWAQLDERMVSALRAPSPDLPSALAAYLAFYRIWAGEVAPLLAAARAALPDRLAAVLGDRDRAERITADLLGPRTTTVAARLTAAARGELDESAVLAAIGNFAPRWDVAAPTFAETPGVIRAAIERARHRSAAPPRPASGEVLAAAHGALGDELEPALTLARFAADLSELDDVRFAEAQAQVRRALLAIARQRGLDPADVFWLPLDEVARTSATALDDADIVRARAAGARAAAARAATWAMPLVVVDGAAAPLTRNAWIRNHVDVDGDGDDLQTSPFTSTSTTTTTSTKESGSKRLSIGPSHGALRGVGAGPRAAGPIVHVGAAADGAAGGLDAVAAGSIAVVRAVTPALAIALDPAAAIIAEHGGVLDHGAALARELGITCITGCTGAWDALVDGQWVIVDGDQGTVTAVDGAPLPISARAV